MYFNYGRKCILKKKSIVNLSPFTYNTPEIPQIRNEYKTSSGNIRIKNLMRV
jgi:hypothetical protein